MSFHHSHPPHAIRYQVIDLGDADPIISSNGHIARTVQLKDGGKRILFGFGRSKRTIPIVDEHSAFARAINNRGDWVGHTFTNTDNQSYAALFHRGQRFNLHRLLSAAVPSRWPESDAAAVNDHDQVAINADDGDNIGAYLYGHGSIRPIPFPKDVRRMFLGKHRPAEFLFTCRGMNQAGEVVADLSLWLSSGVNNKWLNMGALLSNGHRTHSLNTPFTRHHGWRLLSAASINDKETITGDGLLFGCPRAYLLRHRSIIALLPLPGQNETVAFALNGRDQAVGFSARADQNSLLSRLPDSSPYSPPQGTQPHAALWLQGYPIDLNHAIPQQAGWTLTEATGISNQGWIVGTGEHHGHPRAFLLKPLPTRRR